MFLSYAQQYQFRVRSPCSLITGLNECRPSPGDKLDLPQRSKQTVDDVFNGLARTGTTGD